jgi:hypothetical protein
MVSPYACRLALSAELLTFALASAFAQASAVARDIALVVGVSKYPSLSEERWLPGARNDAISVAHYLRGRGFAAGDVTVLGEKQHRGHEPTAGLPTRAAILKALSALASRAGPGDFVYIYFSGHGSRQPSRNPESARGTPKPDGLDTTFLPRDIGRWDEDLQTVRNAIIDDEFLDAITRIRNQGAFVWAVFDSCHSEGITRGPRHKERNRGVEARDLGIPEAAIERARERSLQPREMPGDMSAGKLLPDPRIPLGPGAGDAVVFSAALSRETTPEGVYAQEGTDAGGSAAAEEHGLFTFVLLQILAKRADLTYGQLIKEVQARYAAMNRDSPNPVMHGDAEALAFNVPTRQ